ncbi:MAG TPA: amidohydrolase family protein [Vicinamibacteria bacterium]|jgi:putative selenium metabolism protein SsnA|nr:amidohydrolase family protein [Vicinamibacteria bacterium]
MLLKNAALVALDPPGVERGDLRIEGETIGERSLAISPRPGEEVLDLAGALVLPGLVDAHTHLYSALARGMPGPARAPRSFVEILERVWWRLDRALDEESIYLSGLVGAIEAALSGTTLLVDHHASPSFIRGSLFVLRRAVEEVGLRSVLCYETTDRNGGEGRDRGIEENLAFLADPPTALSRGMVGAHASFTLNEETLARLAAAVRETGASLHVHMAEDQADVDDCRQRYAGGLVERFDRHGLLLPRTLLAHGVHLRPDEIEEAQARGAWIAHNPRSNMNNTVGHAPTDAFKQAALGTDGMGGDMLAEARAAYLKMKDAGRKDAVGATLRLLAGGQRLAAALFGLPFGSLDRGGPADLGVFDYPSPTPFRAENLGGHLLFGLDRSHLRSVLVRGRWVVRDRRLVTVDADAVFARARAAAEALWGRIERL